MKIIIISHGSFAQAALDTAQMIIGKTEDVYALGIKPGEKVEVFEEKLEELLRKSEKEKTEIFVFSDIFFGTPFNTAVRLMKKYSMYHYAGVSMPLILECVTSKDNMTCDELKEHIEEVGKSSFVNVNEFMKKCEE